MNKRVLVTGSCGFIGTNLCIRLCKMGYAVVGIDNLSRRGSENNLNILQGFPNFTFFQDDLSNTYSLNLTMQKIGIVDAVFHLAAQVAVTLSYQDRRADFDNNALASFNLLEGVKQFSPDAYCLYASTNKVFGHITAHVPVSNKHFPLLPYTPYGVSKAIGELYFTEFGRKEIGLTTCALRQSCIYGPHQYGIEDQGWVAWFAIANLKNKGIHIYGDGKQVRDLLFVDDLIDLYIHCMESRITGTYPVGGGPSNAISLMQGLDMICAATGKQFSSIDHQPARAGDQPYFVASLDEISQVTGWSPKVNVAQGISNMVNWLREELCISR